MPKKSTHSVRARPLFLPLHCNNPHWIPWRRHPRLAIAIHRDTSPVSHGDVGGEVGVGGNAFDHESATAAIRVRSSPMPFRTSGRERNSSGRHVIKGLADTIESAETKKHKTALTQILDYFREINMTCTIRNLHY